MGPSHRQFRGSQNLSVSWMTFQAIYQTVNSCAREMIEEDIRAEGEELLALEMLSCREIGFEHIVSQSPGSFPTLQLQTVELVYVWQAQGDDLGSAWPSWFRRIAHKDDTNVLTAIVKQIILLCRSECLLTVLTLLVSNPFSIVLSKVCMILRGALPETRVDFGTSLRVLRDLRVKTLFTMGEVWLTGTSRY